MTIEEQAEDMKATAYTQVKIFAKVKAEAEEFLKIPAARKLHLATIRSMLPALTAWRDAIDNYIKTIEEATKP